MNGYFDFAEVPKIVVEERTGLVFILGAADTGKTTLLKLLAESFLGLGLRVGLVDADVGQSTIGPPTTIGMALAQDKPADFFWPQKMYFIGDNNPVGHLIDVLVGSKLMVDESAKRSPDVVIFDSSGLVQPPYGTVLKYHKIELMKPQVVIALEKGTELAPIVTWLMGCTGVKVLRVRPPSEVKPKSVAKRARYREEQYGRYLKNSVSLVLNRADLSLYPPDFLNAKADLTGLVVGIQDDKWNTLSIGIIDDLSRETVSVFAPFPEGAGVCGLLAGSIKLSHAGIEIGRIQRPESRKQRSDT